MRWLSVLVVAIAAGVCNAESGTVRVMSFNLWHGGEGKPAPLEQVAAVIRNANADIVGVQEAYGRERWGVRPDNSRELAQLLGFHHVDQGNGKTVLSRHEIIGLTPGRHGALIRLPNRARLYCFNVHLFHAPYQPYQVLGIPYEDAPFLKTEAELVAAAEAARGPELAATLAEMKTFLDQGEAAVLTGDFNEPSHLDWSVEAAEAKLVPLPVAYPASRQVEALGLRDTWRTRFPDEVSHPGHTWTPITEPTDPADRHDRIDFVYVSEGIEVKDCAISGEKQETAGIVTAPYPSDHRGVVATLTLPQD